MDITLCKGNGCLLRDKCKRATSKPSEMQSWFTDEPFRIVEGKFTCEMFWGEPQTEILNQLKEITNEETGEHDNKGTAGAEGHEGISDKGLDEIQIVD